MDDAAVAMTGIDSGWDKYWNDVIADSANYPGCMDFCKLVSFDGVPVGAVVFGCYCGDAVISEIVVAPYFRGKGFGPRIIQELVTHADVWFDDKINRFHAVIFSDNEASQKAFLDASFVLCTANGDSPLEYIYDIQPS